MTTVGTNMYKFTFPLKVFLKIVYKLDNTIDLQMKYKIVKADKFRMKNEIQKIKLVMTRP